MIKVQSNIVFDYLAYSKTRITVMQGGTRSGKTYNILLFFVIKLLGEQGKVFTICRASLPSIKGSVLRDFMEILLKLQLYQESSHNKTENTYILNNNVIEFVSIDQPQKIRGRKRNYLFINEANEINYDSWMQLTFRTEEKIVIDYNPSDEFSWIYSDVITRKDADFYVTTYKDNPFLPAELVNEVERLKEADENYWRVYGLGERGISRDIIYSPWRIVKSLPGRGERWYGQDFGYNVQSALVEIEMFEGAIYIDELIYETKLTTNDLIERYKELMIEKKAEIFCDNAEPKTIEELVRARYNAKPADKDVTEGIRKVKSMVMHITERSVNIIKEMRGYKWKTDKNGNVLDEPVKFMDHAMDAIRYGVFTKLQINKKTWLVM